MNILILIRILGAIAVTLTLAWCYHAIDQGGYTRAMTERDAKDAQITIAAQAQLAEENEKIRAAQAALTKAIFTINANQEELQNEKLNSAVYQSQLASGDKRLRALVTRSKSSDAEQGTGPAAANLDQRTEVIEDLSPIVGASIERLRLNENEAIDRLDACIGAYDAVFRAQF